MIMKISKYVIINERKVTLCQLILKQVMEKLI